MDYVFVGAGPSALTAAWYLAQAGKTCTLIEQQPVIGGCHRVLRETGFFTEHGPRIYSTSYVNFRALLEDMHLNFRTLFTPYHFNISSIGKQTLKSVLSLRELGVFGVAYLYQILSPSHGMGMTMDEFMDMHHFSPESKEYIDRLCRLSDGAGSERYTLNQFLQLVNQEGLYSLQQPTLPNDKGLFKLWEAKLIETKNVNIQVNSTVVDLIAAGDRLTGVLVRTKDGLHKIQGQNVILAIPPIHVLPLLKHDDAFGPQFRAWAVAHQYMTYISITFHWTARLDLPDIWGFSPTKWGLVFVVLSDYMPFTLSKTVISVALTTYPKQTPRHLLLSETFRQLKESYPGLPPPDQSIVNPNNYLAGEWRDRDSGYVRTPYKIGDSMFLPAKSVIFPNLYNLGTQNGHSAYAFTSMESAVSNAVSFVNTQLSTQIQKHQGRTVNELIVLFVIFLVMYYSSRPNSQ